MSFQFFIRIKNVVDIYMHFRLIDKGSLDKFRSDWVMFVKAIIGNHEKTEEIKLQVVHNPARSTVKDSPAQTAAASASSANNVTSESEGNQVNCEAGFPCRLAISNTRRGTNSSHS